MMAGNERARFDERGPTGPTRNHHSSGSVVAD